MGTNRRKTGDKKTLHVLFTGLVYEGVITGGDQLFLDIAPRLPKDIKVTVVTSEFAKSYWDNIDKSNIDLRLLPPNFFENKSNPFFVFISFVIRAWQTYRILKNEDVQTIYSCSDIAYADIWPAYWLRAKRPNVKWISRVYHVLLPPEERQGNWFVNMVAFRLQRLSFWMMKRRSTMILALNKKLRRELLDLGFPEHKLDILEAGIDFQEINRFKKTVDYPYDVVALGRIAPVKGIFDTVKAWEIVHKQLPSARMAWLGGGGDNHRKRMVEMIEQRSLSKSFELLGYVSKDEKYNILKNAKVFLCPDHENGWGLAVCEAMASGLPVVSYDLDIFGGVYQKGYRSVPLFDTNSLAKEIVNLLEDSDTRKSTAKDAISQASEFDHQGVVDKLVKFIG